VVETALLASVQVANVPALGEIKASVAHAEAIPASLVPIQGTWRGTEEGYAIIKDTNKCTSVTYSCSVIFSITGTTIKLTETCPGQPQTTLDGFADSLSNGLLRWHVVSQGITAPLCTTWTQSGASVVAAMDLMNLNKCPATAKTVCTDIPSTDVAVFRLKVDIPSEFAPMQGHWVGTEEFYSNEDGDCVKDSHSCPITVDISGTSLVLTESCSGEIPTTAKAVFDTYSLHQLQLLLDMGVSYQSGCMRWEQDGRKLVASMDAAEMDTCPVNTQALCSDDHNIATFRLTCISDCAYPDAEGLSTGAKVGIAIGVLAGVVLTTGAGVWVWKYRSGQSKKPQYFPVNGEDSNVGLVGSD